MAFCSRWVLLGLLLLLSVSCKLGRTTSSDEPTAMEYCTKGWAAYKAGNYSGAVSHFSTAKNLDITLPEAYVGLGWAYMQTGNFSGAQTELTTAKGKLPNDIRVLIARASIFIKDNNANAVIDELFPVKDGTDTWVHPQDSKINAVDIHNLMAEAYIITNVKGTEAGSLLNAADAWGQVKKSLELRADDAKALELRKFLRGE